MNSTNSRYTWNVEVEPACKFPRWFVSQFTTIAAPSTYDYCFQATLIASFIDRLRRDSTFKEIYRRISLSLPVPNLIQWHTDAGREHGPAARLQSYSEKKNLMGFHEFHGQSTITIHAISIFDHLPAKIESLMELGSSVWKISKVEVICTAKIDANDNPYGRNICSQCHL